MVFWGKIVGEKNAFLENLNKNDVLCFTPKPLPILDVGELHWKEREKDNHKQKF